MTDELLNRLRQSPVVGRYFEDDGQLVVVAGGSDDAPPADPPPADPPAGDPPADPPPAAGDAGQVTMTQTELDAMIQKRLGQAKKGWETDAQTQAQREKMDEVERLRAEKADADTAIAEVTERANRRLVQADAKVTAVGEGANPARVDALLKLVDLSDVTVDDDGSVDTDAVAAAIKKGLEEFPEFKATGASGAGRSGGDFNGGATKTWTREEITKLSDDEFDKNKDAIQAAMSAGNVA